MQKVLEGIKNKLLGTLSDVSTLSFANKIITTGEGGAVLTNSKKKYLMMKEMRDHGINIIKYKHVRWDLIMNKQICKQLLDAIRLKLR